MKVHAWLRRASRASSRPLNPLLIVELDMTVDPRWLCSKIPEAAVFTPLSGSGGVRHQPALRGLDLAAQIDANLHGYRTAGLRLECANLEAAAITLTFARI